VPIFNLMEDAATAEISRSQVWQWMRSPKGVLDDGRKVTRELFHAILGDELAKTPSIVGAEAYRGGQVRRGREALRGDHHVGRLRRVPHPARVRQID
jgi:malate synthase